MTTRKTNSATARLKQDYLRLKKDPVPYVVAEPLPANILEWYVSHYFVSICWIFFEDLN
jgi:ubiquitin-conjugating enzyme E2 J2